MNRVDILMRHAKYYAHVLSKIRELGAENQYKQYLAILRAEWGQIKSGFHHLYITPQKWATSDIIYEYASPHIELYLSPSEQIQWLLRVLEISQANDDTLLKSHTLHHIAHVYFIQGEYQTALQYEEEAINIAQIHKDEDSLLQMFNTTGNILRHDGKYDSAMRMFRAVIHVSRKLHLPEHTVDALYNLTLLHQHNEDWKKAQHCIFAIKKIANQNDNHIWLAMYYDLFGSFHMSHGSVLDAINNYQQALSIYKELNDLPNIASAYSSLGQAFYRDKNLSAALENYKNAYQTYELIERDISSANMLLKVATLQNQLNLSSPSEILSKLRTAIGIFSANKDENGLRASYEKIGSYYYNMNQYQKAITHYEVALAYVKDRKDDRDKYYIASKIADCYRELEKLEDALSYYNQKLTYASESRYFKGCVYSLQDLAEVSNELSKPESAIAYWQQTITLSQQHEFKSDLKYGLWKLAEVYESISDFMSAIDCYQRGLDIAVELEDVTTQNICLHGLANLYYATDEFASALAMLQKLIDQHSDPEQLGYIQNKIGDNYFAMGEFDKAKTHYLNARAYFISIKRDDLIATANSNLQDLKTWM